jgi:hypothetical protein
MEGIKDSGHKREGIFPSCDNWGKLLKCFFSVFRTLKLLPPFILCKYFNCSIFETLSHKVGTAL